MNEAGNAVAEQVARFRFGIAVLDWSAINRVSTDADSKITLPEGQGEDTPGAWNDRPKARRMFLPFQKEIG
jgi:hypothetical protein